VPEQSAGCREIVTGEGTRPLAVHRTFIYPPIYAAKLIDGLGVGGEMSVMMGMISRGDETGLAVARQGSMRKVPLTPRTLPSILETATV
jgi:uncharacterized membrane protein